METEYILKHDVPATIIPAGDPTTLKEGTAVLITQALGGSVTVRTQRGLFRIAANALDALGEETAESLRQQMQAAEKQPTNTEGPLTEEQVWEALRGCFDPEIPVNIVDLGLIYDLSIDGAEDPEGATVAVKMTLTARGCGMGPVIADDAKTRIEALPQVKSATVDIIWEPAWTPHMISEAGRAKLGF
jgi:probable FeS assembly SUF system protein SufT